MNKNIKTLIAILITFSIISKIELEASTTATATVTYTIGSIDSISVSGSPGPLVVNSAVAGSGPSSAVDSSTSYSVTTNNSGRMVTGSLALNMPTGVILSVELDAPTGAISAGSIDLTTTPVCLVDGISNLAESALTAIYTLSATADASQVTNATNTVTYTIMGGS